MRAMLPYRLRNPLLDPHRAQASLVRQADETGEVLDESNGRAEHHQWFSTHACDTLTFLRTASDRV